MNMKTSTAKIGIGTYWPNGIGVPGIGDDTCPLRMSPESIGKPRIGVPGLWPGL